MHRRGFNLKKLAGEKIDKRDEPLTEESDKLCAKVWEELLKEMNREEVVIQRIRTQLKP